LLDELILSIIGVVIGTLSGFFGIGGGTVLVPLLLLMGLEMKVAVGISVMQMVFSSIFGSYINYRKGSLLLGEGIFVGFGGFVGGYISTFVTQNISDTLLQYTFISFVLFAIYRLAVSSEPQDDTQNRTLPKALLFIIGVAIGIIAITIGVGGAIILIPLLSGFLHYPIKKAVSAGLFFVVFSSVAGLVSRLLHSEVDIYRGLTIGIASLIGVYIGVLLKDRVHSKHHKIFIVGMYLFILAIMGYKIFFDS